MKRLILLSSSLLILNGCSTTPDVVSDINQEISSQPTASGMPDFPPAALADRWGEGYILVQPRPGLSADDFDSVLRGNRGHSLGRIQGLSVHKIQVPPQAEEAVARALSRNPSIKFAERDMLVQFNETLPDDPKYAEAWHLPMMQAPFAWSLSQGNGVTIAILDTGVYGEHPDLSSNMIAGWNSVDGSTDTADIYGHGTAVAGTAAAASNNALGIASVTWNAKIMPIRITNRTDGYAYWSDIARGLTWAADNGADVANISYGVSNSSTVSSAAQYMRNKNGVVVVAAGNDGIDTGYSDNPYMITVAATNSSDVKTSYSNYGNFLDVAAPGDYILTTNRSGGYNSWRGTSFASPATAGVVALIMAANPNLTPDEVEAVLENSADDLVSGSDWHIYYGHGRVNAAAAVAMAIDTTVADTEQPSVTIFSPTANSEASASILVEVNATDNTGVNSVSLYANGQHIASDNTAPYQFSWDSTTTLDGEATLTATAIDAADNEGVSSDVVVMVNNQVNEPVVPAPTPEPTVDSIAPSVSIGSPTDGSKIKNIVKISASASDNIKVTGMELYIDGNLKSSGTSNSISYKWSARRAAKGSHTIRVVAFDAASNSSETQVQVNK
ncbi:MAG: thermitase [Methyloprofundus sp.]|nr:MAG: thermitase [Methyloprofundus sp.]